MRATVQNYCFIDGQNLHRGTRYAATPWSIDHKKLRIYLKDKYHVDKAYYFIGYKQPHNYLLYNTLQEAGYILRFRPHSTLQASTKKGNVDIDIVFEIMRTLIDNPNECAKMVLVSGDGDFKRVVDYLIARKQFAKILFPNKRHSSLYKKLESHYFDTLSNPTIRGKIENNRAPA